MLPLFSSLMSHNKYPFSLFLVLQVLIMPMILKAHQHLAIIRTRALVHYHRDANYVIDDNTLYLYRKDKKHFVIQPSLELAPRLFSQHPYTIPGAPQNG